MLSPSRITLTDLATEWLKGPGAELAQSTRITYVGLIEKHVLSYLGSIQITQLNVATVQDWQTTLRLQGVSPDPRHRALKYLRMLLSFAVSRGYLTNNCATFVKPPKLPTKKPPTPLSPDSIERLRKSGEQLELSCVVSLMGYAGLRPSEAFALRWMDVHERTLLITSTKTNRVDSVAMLAPLAADLREWRIRSGMPEPNQLVIPRIGGGEWTRTAKDNWRKRVFDPACARARVSATPYTLRHSFASLLIHAHYPVTYVAQQMRHSLEMTMRHYAHVIADLDPSHRIDPEQAIWEARGEQKGNRSGM